MWASGARSPDAPTDPWQGTTGVRPRSSIAPEEGHRRRPDTRGPLAQAGQLQGHHQASDRHRHRFADAGGVRQDEVPLERREVAGRDPHAGQLAEAGVDAVDRLAAGHDGGHGVSGAGDTRERAGSSSQAPPR